MNRTQKNAAVILDVIQEIGAMTKRAERRHHVDRLKRKRKYHFGRELSGKELSQVVDTPKPCSCYLCGNPRKYFEEKTVQEHKHDA